MREAALLPALALAACATAAPPPPPEVPVHGEVPGYTCRDPGDGFVGQQATAELGARLLAQSGARTLRWVAHGSMITMEFSPSRLTVHLDAGNRVERLSCG